MRTFEDALRERVPPRRVGDIRLSYEPSLLMGESIRLLTTWQSALTLLLGTISLIFAAVAAVATEDLGLPLGLLIVGSASLVLSHQRYRIDRRRRRFVLNFDSESLRFDFVTRFWGLPKSVTISFDDVRDVHMLEDAHGRRQISVDFVTATSTSNLMRQVLVASIGDAEVDQAEQLRSFLARALGVERVPGLMKH